MDTQKKALLSFLSVLGTTGVTLGLWTEDVARMIAEFGVKWVMLIVLALHIYSAAAPTIKALFTKKPKEENAK